jgi:hypothetical protein
MKMKMISNLLVAFVAKEILCLNWISSKLKLKYSNFKPSGNDMKNMKEREPKMRQSFSKYQTLKYP